jgi:hypothetical protein
MRATIGDFIIFKDGTYAHLAAVAYAAKISHHFTHGENCLCEAPLQLRGNRSYLF